MICPNYLLTHFNAAVDAAPLIGLVFSFVSVFDDGPFITDTPEDASIKFLF